jgi:hypothetical protein
VLPVARPNTQFGFLRTSSATNRAPRWQAASAVDSMITRTDKSPEKCFKQATTETPLDLAA